MIWAVLAGLLALAGAYFHPVTVDEAWSLVVARRVNRGDRLYRDVFYGAAPLAIWILSLSFRVLRPQGLVVRALTVLYVLVEVSAAVVLVGPRSVTSMAVVGLMMGCGGMHLGLHNHYGHLTMAATLWSAVFLSSGHPVVAGALVGLGLLGRYSVGVAAAAALGGSLALTGDGAGALSFLAASLIPVALAIVVRPSSLPWFLRRAVANKREYLEKAGFNPLRWIRHRSWSGWRSRALQIPVVAAMALVTLAPMAGLVGVVREGDLETAIPFALTLLGLAVVYPRFDGVHAVAAVTLSGPALLLMAAGTPGLLWIGLLAWGLAAAALIARVGPIGRSGSRRNLPSLRHLPVRRLMGGVWADEAGALPAEVFVLRPDAPLIYACGGVSNPTPFDYPAASTFGSRGQAMVLERFEAGMALCDGWVDRTAPLAPKELLDGIPADGGCQTSMGRLISLSATRCG